MIAGKIENGLERGFVKNSLLINYPLCLFFFSRFYLTLVATPDYYTGPM